MGSPLHCCPQSLRNLPSVPNHFFWLVWLMMIVSFCCRFKSGGCRAHRGNDVIPSFTSCKRSPSSQDSFFINFYLMIKVLEQTRLAVELLRFRFLLSTLLVNKLSQEASEDDLSITWLLIVTPEDNYWYRQTKIMVMLNYMSAALFCEQVRHGAYTICITVVCYCISQAKVSTIIGSL